MATIVVTNISVTPPKMTLPEKFADEVTKMNTYVTELETYMSSLTLPTLKKIEAALEAGGSLPFNLDPYKVDVEAFLQTAIGIATDVITLAQMVTQLSAIQATPVVPATPS